MPLDIRSPAPLPMAPVARLGILLDEQELPELNCVRARERASIE
jgi:xanthosine utilization system XapX-like protein